MRICQNHQMGKDFDYEVYRHYIERLCDVKDLIFFFPKVKNVAGILSEITAS